jgi:HAMP domain-containing protein
MTKSLVWKSSQQDIGAMAAHRRQIANLVQKPTTQLKQTMSIFAFVVLATVVVQVVLVGAMQQAVADAALQAGIDHARMQSVLGERLAGYSTRIVLGFPLLAVCAMFLALRLSHRYLGPQVPIRRHLSSLIAGDYSSRCQLRANDELWEISGDLNELAERLQRRHGVDDELDAEDAAVSGESPESPESSEKLAA